MAFSNGVFSLEGEALIVA